MGLPVGLLSAALKARIRAGSELYWLHRISFPGGTKQYSQRPVNSLSEGVYEGRIVGVGRLSRGSMDRAFSLEPLQLNLTIADAPSPGSSERFFAELLESANGNDIANCAAVTQLTAPGIVPADRFTLHTGIIEESGWESELTYYLRLRTDDRPLRRSFPKDLIALSNWPNAHASAVSKPAPSLLGKFDTGGGTTGGALPTLYVDKAGFRYMVCRRWAKNVNRVYVAGTQVLTGFTITHPLVAGRRYTLVVFDTDQGDNAVTVDAEGEETIGDGSGTLIENPADQFKHVLVNDIYGDAKDLPLPDTTAPIDTAWFDLAADFLDARGHKGARYQGGDTRRNGKALVDEWCSSYQCRPFWTNLGKLAIRFEDHGETSIYLDDPWLQWQRHLGAFKLRYDTQQVMDRVNASYLRNEVRGDYTQTLETRDPRLTLGPLDSFAEELPGTPDSLELPWAYAVTS